MLRADRRETACRRAARRAERSEGNLARNLRAGDLVGIYVPEATDEAIRDLCRARQRLKSILLQHAYHDQGIRRKRSTGVSAFQSGPVVVLFRRGPRSIRHRR